jgi:hypothetical protein
MGGVGKEGSGIPRGTRFPPCGTGPHHPLPGVPRLHHPLCLVHFFPSLSHFPIIISPLLRHASFGFFPRRGVILLHCAVASRRFLTPWLLSLARQLVSPSSLSLLAPPGTQRSPLTFPVASTCGLHRYPPLVPPGCHPLLLFSVSTHAFVTPGPHLMGASPCCLYS